MLRLFTAVMFFLTLLSCDAVTTTDAEVKIFTFDPGATGDITLGGTISQ